MSAPGRILHVIRKDIRHARGLLVAWIGVVAVAILDGAGVIVVPEGLWFLVRASLIVGPLLLAAWSVREDPPTSTNAYWSLHPLAGREVLAAKVLLVFVVGVALPLLAQWAALRTFPARADELFALMLLSAAVLGLGVLAAMILGSVFRTFWGVVAFFPAVLFVGVGIQTVLWTSVGVGDRYLVSLPWTGWIVWSLAGLAVLFLAYLYRSRDARLRVRVVGAVLSFHLVIYAVTALAGGPAVAAWTGADASELVEARVDRAYFPENTVLPSAQSSQLVVARVGLRFPDIPGYSDDTPDRRLRLENTRVRLLDSGGELVARRSIGGGQISGSAGMLRLPVRADEPDRLRDGRLTAEIEGWLVTRVLRDVGTIPFEAGAELSTEGMRLRVRNVTELGLPVIEVQRVHLPGHPDVAPIRSSPMTPELTLSGAFGSRPLEVRSGFGAMSSRFPLPGPGFARQTLSISEAPAPGSGLSLTVRSWEVESVRHIRFRLPALPFAENVEEVGGGQEVSR